MMFVCVNVVVGRGLHAERSPGRSPLRDEGRNDFEPDNEQADCKKNEEESQPFEPWGLCEPHEWAQGLIIE